MHLNKAIKRKIITSLENIKPTKYSANRANQNNSLLTVPDSYSALLDFTLRSTKFIADIKLRAKRKLSRDGIDRIFL